MISSYAQQLARRGGMACCGEHLGIMVASHDCIQKCPPGWIFLDLETATPEQVQEALDLARQGRSSWPPKADI